MCKSEIFKVTEKLSKVLKKCNIFFITGNTPLHLIVMYQKVVGDFLTLHSIITSLIEAGAHVDVINNQGKTPMKKATTGVAEIILKSQQKVSLKCLSAQAIKRHGLCFKGHVPASLEQFINLHGP